MKKLTAFLFLTFFCTGLLSAIKQTLIGEVFYVDRSKLEIIISGKTLENIPDGQILQILDNTGSVIATVKSTKNNLATLKAAFVSGQFGLIREKMGVAITVEEIMPNEKTNSNIRTKKQEDEKMIEPVKVKILDENQPSNDNNISSEQNTSDSAAKWETYKQKRLSVPRLVLSEGLALCLPGSGLGHYLVKDVKGGILVNILAGSGIALYIVNEYALEYWNSYRNNSADLYSSVHYLAMGVYAAGYLYDLIDTPIKWWKHNKKLKQELGISFIPTFDGFYAGLMYRF